MYHSRRKKYMKDFAKNISGNSVLDIGSGIGIFNSVLRELGFKKIVALDNDKKTLEINTADEKYSINLEKQLPFPNNYFDSVFAVEIIEHLENRKQLLNEIYRVLKPNGYLILTTPNKDSLIARFDKIIGRLVDGKWIGHDCSHKYVYGFKELIKEIKNSKFAILRISTFCLFYGLTILTGASKGRSVWILARKTNHKK
jgi:2-polyprenyl-3-methyl-5-hydroxy-6-metoxy-1,4-benzoquinol methylase